MAPAPLILASASPRRQALLAQIGLTPDGVAPADIDETPHPGETPRALAERLARGKAAAVARAGVYTLAADTVVAVGRRVLPKTEDEAAARRCLALLSGRRHRVWTGVCVIAPDGRTGFRFGDAQVGFKRLTEAEIADYIAGGEWRGKAGGYAIQGAAAAFSPQINGSYTAIVGLPLYETKALLIGLGWRPG